MTTGQRIEILDVTDTAVSVVKPVQQGKIYIRSVKGAIETFRRSTGLVFLTLFLALPWLNYAGHQAILLDFSAQRFHFFGLTLWPQDLTLFAWLFIVAAFALFFVTAIFGRVWCGFMCPQTVFTFLFVWVEEKIEGARNKRIHLDKQPSSAQKLLKKSSKHAIWLTISVVTAFTFVGYFTPIRPLTQDILSTSVSFWPGFYIALFALCTYANAGWMRELMCTHMCPYSRFQSSMFDNDTLTVTYDRQRGDGRGPRPRKMSSSEYQAKGLGDCIDCNLCVQVCPTEIDIRNGLQYECINCGACVDACNGVMANMGYQADLISYTSQNALSGKPSRLLRPKVIGYFVVLLIMTGALVLDIVMRKPLDMDVIRDRTSLFKEHFNGNVENVYTLVLKNKSQVSQRFTVSIEGLQTSEIIGEQDVVVAGSELVRYPLSVVVDPVNLTEDITHFTIRVDNQQGNSVSEQVTFINRL